ncbi:MAG TPA: hypothetical protein VFS43_06485 [Polyangiaceae bacterium]|nr:hypothetical protein [Polyangiaceae bacterium]
MFPARWRERPGRRLRGGAPGLVAAALAALAAPGCQSPELPVGVRDPENVLDESAWAHVLVFDGGCPPLGDVVLGTYDSPRYEQIAEADEGFEAIGSLSAGAVGFALVARSNTCQVVGVGCTNANLRDVDRVDIVVGRVYDSAARTACGAECVEGQCVAAGASETGAGPDPARPF